jgi:hypothetical protein
VAHQARKPAPPIDRALIIALHNKVAACAGDGQVKGASAPGVVIGITY